MADPDARRAPPFRNIASQSGRLTGLLAGGLLPALPFAIRLWIALVIVIAASALTIVQSTRPDAFRPPQALLSFSWWRYPLEWNATARLPKVECNLNAIYAVPSATQVWAAGNKGMVVVSSDGGSTWTSRKINQELLNPPRPPPGAGSTSSDDLERFRRFQERAARTGPKVSSTPSAVTSTTISSENGSLIWVNYTDKPLVEAVNNLGTNFTTTDGGINWDRESLRRYPIYANDPVSQQPVRLRSLQTLATKVGRDYVAVDFNGKVHTSLPINLGAFVATGAQFLDPRTGWVIGQAGGYTDCIWHTRDGGKTWILSFTDPRMLTKQGIHFINENQGWMVGSDGMISVTSDGGKNWQWQSSYTHSQLNSVNFLPDGQRGWIAGDDGLILNTNDGGATWVHRTQGNDAGGRYLRFPAPWYFLVLLLVGLTLLRRTQAILSEPEESVADLLVSDRPLDSSAGDVLAFNSIALGLSRFLRNENTMPPLTVAIIGEWGTGKSSLMNLLRADLRSYKFRPVWFNAWHHQKEEHMLASLLENIKLQAVPRWWSNRGLVFRAKLLGIRGWRHWLPLVLLLFFIYVLLIYHFGREGTDASYAGLMNWLAAAGSHPLDTASNLVPFVPLLAGIFTFLGAVWRGITAFGVKPASLLAGVSAGASIRGLEAQTSFRQKFALEFNDVTRALGKRSLLLFIDDLDRCRPENVLETLEAVNFLTTSGECFVVIGMAREYVERCVGRAFKDIAEEMIDDVDKSQPARGEDQSPDELAKEKRIEFARQYLDKLINIEVPIPAANQGQSLKLLLAGAYQPSVPELKSGWQEFKSSAAGLLARHWRVLPALTALAVLLTLGYFLAMSLIGQSPASPATTQLTPTPDVSPSPSQTPTPTSPPSAVGARTPTPTPTPPPSPSPTAEMNNERAEIIAGGRALFSRNVLPAIALLAMLWLGVTVLTRRPDLVVKDSPNFVDALRIWHPLIYSRQSTPRSIKRFMNRIRYLAMRQRKATEGEQSWFRRLFGSNQPGETQPNTGPETERPVEPIPDEALVALAALEHFDRPFFMGLGRGASNLALASAAAVYPGRLQTLVSSRHTAHEQRFGKLDVLKYRDRYLEMSASVEVR